MTRVMCARAVKIGTFDDFKSFPTNWILTTHETALDKSRSGVEWTENELINLESVWRFQIPPRSALLETFYKYEMRCSIRSSIRIP